MNAVPISEAAIELEVPPGTLRRWVREGLPVVRRGRPGRGHSTLIDVNAARAWRDGENCEDMVVTLAAEIPELMASAIWDVHKLSNGPHHGQVANALAAAWYSATTKLLDRLKDDAPEVPEIETLPEKIERLRAF